MRRVMAVVGAMAIMTLASGAAHAQFHFGMNYFQFNNWDNAGAAFEDGGWTATADGAIWTKTGSTYALNWQDLNLRLDFRMTPTSPWATVTNTCLLSNGVAYQDVNFNTPPDPAGAYPGYWYCQQEDPSSPCHMGAGQYYLPGTYDPINYPNGRPTQTGMQFNMYAWTGNYSTFADAAAAGEQVGLTGAFQVGPTMYWISPMSDPFNYMPSLVLAKTYPGDANLDGAVNITDLSKVLTNYDKNGMTWSDGDFNGDGTVNISDLSNVLTNYDKTATASAGLTAVPEPSTLGLAAAGLAGLLAIAWRKHR